MLKLQKQSNHRTEQNQIPPKQLKTLADKSISQEIVPKRLNFPKQI